VVEVGVEVVEEGEAAILQEWAAEDLLGEECVEVLTRTLLPRIIGGEGGIYIDG